MRNLLHAMAESGHRPAPVPSLQFVPRHCACVGHQAPKAAVLDRRVRHQQQLLGGVKGDERSDVPPRGEELLQSLRNLSLDGGLREDGSLVATLRFRGPDRAWAEARVEQLRELVASSLSESELDLKISSTSSGDVVSVEVRANDIIGTLRRGIEEQQERSGVKINL